MVRGPCSLLFLFFFCFRLALQLLLISTGKANSEYPSKHNIVPFFIFGDSFVDAGNNNYIHTTTLDQANFWPYGETYFKFPTGRFSDGRLVPDFIAEYANLPFIPPFLQPGIDQHWFGVNFASGGAGALVETFQGDVIDLKTQLRYYKKVENGLRHKLGTDEAKMKISKAVYLFSIGSNDYMSPFLTNSTALLNSYSNSKYVGMVIGNLTSVIQEIYKIGGRKFALMNLPALGCLPAIRTLRPGNNGRCLKEISLLTAMHNQALSNLLYEMEKNLKGFKYSLFDLRSSLQQRMETPSKFGFKEGKTACCGTGPYGGVYSCGGNRPVKEFELCENPNDFVFWDSFHLTEMAYKQLAEEMWSLNSPNIVGPSSLEQFFQS